MVNLLEKEIKTYEKNKIELLENSRGKFVLIKGHEIIDIFENKLDAIRQGYKKFGNVPFLVKQVLELESPQYFTSHIFGI